MSSEAPFCGDGLSDSLLNQLPRHYGAIFWLNETLARFGRKRAEINKKTGFWPESLVTDEV